MPKKYGITAFENLIELKLVKLYKFRGKLKKNLDEKKTNKKILIKKIKKDTVSASVNLNEKVLEDYGNKSLMRLLVLALHILMKFSVWSSIRSLMSGTCEILCRVSVLNRHGSL